MDTKEIIAGLRAERDRIDKAITALEAVEGIVAPSRRGRPKGSVAVKPAKPAKKTGKKAKRILSPEAKARIAAAQKNRWAKVKKAEKAAKAE
jgi:hypothetical protein